MEIQAKLRKQRSPPSAKSSGFKIDGLTLNWLTSAVTLYTQIFLAGGHTGYKSQVQPSDAAEERQCFWFGGLRKVLTSFQNAGNEATRIQLKSFF